MNKFTTSQIAKIVNVHPNTVRLYEQIGFLPLIPRKNNFYRQYNDFHLEQLKLIRLGLKSELLQNGLRKEVIEIIRSSADGNFEKSLSLCNKHLQNISKEQKNAEESIEIVKNKLNEYDCKISDEKWTRKKLAMELDITIDTLRNWELNGLLNIKRNNNGYRIYNNEDVKKIKIIRALRCSNFSLSSILRLLNDLERNSNIDVKKSIDTPRETDDIISACDKLITSLNNAKQETLKMKKQIKKITLHYNTNL